MVESGGVGRPFDGAGPRYDSDPVVLLVVPEEGKECVVERDLGLEHSGVPVDHRLQPVVRRTARSNSSGGLATSEAQPGHATSFASGSGSNSQVVISGGTGKAHAMSGGHATANSAANCEVIATASNNGTTVNDCLAPRSKAVGIADDGGNAHAETIGTSCEAIANASGDGSDAEAFCNNDGSKVTAIATGGGVAVGSDNQSPQCMPQRWHGDGHESRRQLLLTRQVVAAEKGRGEMVCSFHLLALPPPLRVTTPFFGWTSSALLVTLSVPMSVSCLVAINGAKSTTILHSWLL